jgi:nucleoside-diphosphate-sugar epimerase
MTFQRQYKVLSGFPKIKVLVTGASGFLGGAVARALLDRGAQVVALVRNPNAVKARLPAEVELLPGDITHADRLPSFPSEVDTVVHAAGMLGRFRATESLYRLVNTTGTINVLRASEAAGIKRFLLVSSAGVLGPVKLPPADESWPLAPSNGYERSKAEAERLIRRAHKKGRIRVSVVRPEFIYGPGDHHVLGLFRAVRDRRFFLIGSGNTLLHPTYITDAVQGILAAIYRSNFDDSVFLVAGPRPVSVRELSETAAQALGVSARQLRWPRLAAYSAAAALEVVGRLTRRDVPLTFSRIRFFTENRAFRTSRAETVLGYKPRFSLEEGIAQTVNWYRREGLL